MVDIFPIPGFSEPVACWTHFLAGGAAAIAAWPLIRRGVGRPGRVPVLGLYVFAVLFLFAMSGTFHLLEPGRLPRAVLLRLDHAAIWVMIAGTYTPIHHILFRGFWRWGFLGIFWTLAITGLTLRTIFFNDFSELVGLLLYLGIGWLGAFSVVIIGRTRGWIYAWPIVQGGIAYTVGALLDLFRWPTVIEGVVGPHELFHIAVIAGVFIHWRYIYKIASSEGVG